MCGFGRASAGLYFSCNQAFPGVLIESLECLVGELSLNEDHAEQ
jgi:hypothetical protein